MLAKQNSPVRKAPALLLKLLPQERNWERYGGKTPTLTDDLILDNIELAGGA
jgi:hypothetical protein